MKKFFLILCASLVAPFALAYEPTESDALAVEIFANRVIDIADRDPDIDVDDVIIMIHAFIIVQSDLLTERQTYILEWLADELTLFLEPHMEDIEEEDEVEDEEVTDRRTYDIDGNKIIVKNGEGDRERDEEVWRLFIEMIPSEDRENIVEYHVFDDIDNLDDAWVEQIDDDPTSWILAINLAAVYSFGDLDMFEAVSVLLHEYAHTFTLAEDQLELADLDLTDDEYAELASDCPTLWIMEGCLDKRGYLFEFIKEFWDDGMREYAAEGGSVYREDDFVTEYAATNPGEDIAESFTYFVMNDEADDDEVAGEKVNFFYASRELEDLRDHVRSVVADYDVLDRWEN